jgi:sec-independent protein translocase protein TatA
MLGADVLSPTHLLLVMLAVVLVFGTKKLPELGRGLGTAMREFKGGFTATGTAQEPRPGLEPPTADSPGGGQPKATQSQ